MNGKQNSVPCRRTKHSVTTADVNTVCLSYLNPTSSQCIILNHKHDVCRQRPSPYLVQATRRCWQERPTSCICSHTKQRYCSSRFFISLERITSSLLKLHKRQRQNINYIHHSAVWGEWRTFQFYFPIHCYACLDLLLLSFVPICGICYSHHRSHPSADPERYFLEKHFTHMPCFYYLSRFSSCSSLFSPCSQTFCSFRFLFFVVLVCFVVVFGGVFYVSIRDTILPGERLVVRVTVWVSCLACLVIADESFNFRK